ncbi:MAG: hypothetical protein AB8H86_16965 [Polyangiales bacterium]
MSKLPSVTRRACSVSLGLLLSCLVALESMSLMGCLGPEPEPPPPCEVTPGLATETRVLELGVWVQESSSTRVWTPLVANQEVEKVQGGQGADMLSLEARFPALPEDGIEDRCMLITYSRQGEVGADGEANDFEYTVTRQASVRDGRWGFSVQDIDALGGVDVLVSVEDNVLMGSAEASLVVIPVQF